MQLFDRLIAIDAVLVKAGFPPLSDWWKDVFRRFLEGDQRQLVIRAGRRAGKSSSLCRLATLLALYAPNRIPPGDVGQVVFLSANTTEARARLLTISKILTALGVPRTKKKDAIELTKKPIRFVVVAATISAVVGGTSVCIIADEVSRWRDIESGANPAKEVLASIRPSMATMPHARIVLSSSPLSTNDEHFRAYESGDSEYQLTAQGASWECNPTLSIEATRKLEPDERIWRREFLAVPQAAELSAFDFAAIDRAFEPRSGEPYERGKRVMILDPSSGRKDHFTWAIVGWNLAEYPFERWPDGIIKRLADGTPVRKEGATAVPPTLTVDQIGSFEAGYWLQDSADLVVERLAATARQHRISLVLSDQREEMSLKALFKVQGLKFESLQWTNGSKALAVERVRRWLAEGQLAICQHEKMKSELRSFEEKILPSGSLTYGARGSGHDDFVAILLTAAMADAAGKIPGSPTLPKVYRGMVARRLF